MSSISCNRCALFFVVALLAYYLFPLWRELETWGGTFDWGYFFFLAEVDRKTILEFGQFPFWNPYYCGGAVHLANPQTFFFSPTLVPILIFGTPIGIRVLITAAILIGFDSMRRYARELGLSTLASILAGAAFAVCGAQAQHLGGGHVGWFGFALFPYVLWCLHRALEGRSRYLVYGVFFMAWICGHWGVYQFPYACMMLGIYGVSVGLARNHTRRALALVALLIVVSTLLSSVRLLPLVEFIREHPRHTPDYDRVFPWQFFEVYVRRHTERAWGHQYAWPEYGNYFGYLGASLILVGAWVIVRVRRIHWPVLASMLAFLILSMGNIQGAPWWMLRHLPFFETLRVPSRFTVVVGIFACAAIGFAFDYSRERIKRGGRTVLLAVLLVFCAAYLVDAAQFNRKQWQQTFGTQPPSDRVSQDFHNVSGIVSMMYRFPRANRGSIACFEESPLKISPLLNAHLPIARQERSLSGFGTVTRVRWTPNRIALDVDFSRAGTVLVNQNFDRHWHSSEGSVVSHHGLLAVELPAGARRLELWYAPRLFYWGLAITLVTALGLLVFLWHSWTRRRV